MKKIIQIGMLSCMILGMFSAFAVAGFTKLDGKGHPVPDTDPTWMMVKDNTSGLIWEIKQNMDGVSNYDDPNDADNTYTWYDGNPDTNGGLTGSPGNGMNTETCIRSLNRMQFCGFSDWRLPTIQELANLADTRRQNPSIDTTYFPNTVSSWYWSSSTSVNYPYHAWGVGFRYGHDSYNYKYFHGYVRAVRQETQSSIEKTAQSTGSTEPPPVPEKTPSVTR